MKCYEFATLEGIKNPFYCSSGFLWTCHWTIMRPSCVAMISIVWPLLLYLASTMTFLCG